MGVVSAAIRFAGFEYSCVMNETVSQSLGLLLYLALNVYLFFFFLFLFTFAGLGLEIFDLKFI